MPKTSQRGPAQHRRKGRRLLLASGLMLSTAIWLSCEGSTSPSMEASGGGTAGAPATGNGGSGGAAADPACHTNADCVAGEVCFIAAFVEFGCNSGPAGRCVPYQATACPADPLAPDACDCLTPSYASACAAVGMTAPPQGSAGLTCGGQTGRVSDYTAADGCFHCVYAACDLDGVTHPVLRNASFSDGFPCGDGCNTCWCTPTGLTGTLVACPTGGSSGRAGAGGAGGGSAGGPGGHDGA